MYVAVAGTISQGYNLYGPFETQEAAVEWAESRKRWLVCTSVLEVRDPDSHPVRLEVERQ